MIRFLEGVIVGVLATVIGWPRIWEFIAMVVNQVKEIVNA